NAVLNQVYANVLGKPVLVPDGDVTSLGSAIFAFLVAGAFRTVEEAQEALCPGYRTVEPQSYAVEAYRQLYSMYRELYFTSGGWSTLPELRRIAARARGNRNVGSTAS